ncbi:MAG: polysaccharide biosynthesis protein [Gammaproteobacteria bacterium]|nr:polysaccharide biosynthesis protein [Gammaproteobacteria bacterium]
MKFIKIKRQLSIFFVDLAAIFLAWVGAYLLRFNLGLVPPDFLKGMFLTLPLVLIGQMVVNYGFGLHRGSWRFCSMNDLGKIIKVAMIGLLLTIVLLFISAKTALAPRSVPFIYVTLLILFLGAPRFIYRQWQERQPSSEGTQQRVLIIGGGSAGEGLARDLLRHKSGAYYPVAFIDDSPNKIGREIHSLKVYGDLSTLSDRVKHLKIELLIIAMPSATAQQMQRIVAYCETTRLPFRTVPSLADLTSGRLSLDSLQDVSLEDLLGREQVNLDWDTIASCVRDRVILVSGGAGSIGSELCRQIARFSPKLLLIVDNSEFNLYSIDMELSANKTLAYMPVLLDVTDRDGVRKLVQKYKPSLFFHAAAYKHVPLLEKQLRCALRNNVLGTQVLAEEAVAAGAEKFIMVSTDKAVCPTNVMGATKRIAEIFCQNFNAVSTTQFITVRFGNVLGSAGSVVPLFKKQLKKGGPITVTDPEVTRYFMTIVEATQLILQATSIGKGGEVFVLDMGQPIKIQYLAEQIIQLAGLKVGKDIQIVYTGLRPGEKLHEELFHINETLLPTTYSKISLAEATKVDWTDLQEKMAALQACCSAVDEDGMTRLLRVLVPEYIENLLEDVSKKCSVSVEG